MCLYSPVGVFVQGLRVLDLRIGTSADGLFFRAQGVGAGTIPTAGNNDRRMTTTSQGGALLGHATPSSGSWGGEPTPVAMIRLHGATGALFRARENQARKGPRFANAGVWP